MASGLCQDTQRRLINRTDAVAVLINWLHGESIREHLLRRENRVYANKLMQIADFHRSIQFALNKPRGYVRKEDQGHS